MNSDDAVNFGRRFELATDSREYLLRVEAWRDAWKPPDHEVQVVLVAESHVGEQPGDVESSVRMPQANGADCDWCPPGLPTGYVRLVYCLGYGEPRLCAPDVKCNPGTWQYWKMLAAIAAGSVAVTVPRRGAGESYRELTARIRWKIEVLETLRAKGIWLMDVSPVALYRPGGERLARGARYREVVQHAFAEHVRPRLECFPRLEQVWTIGHVMASALFRTGSPWIRPDRVVAQPQANRGSPGRHERELARMIDMLRSRGDASSTAHG